jgi:hypothetical protein
MITKNHPERQAASPLASFRICTTLTTSRLDLSLFTLECINYSNTTAAAPYDIPERERTHIFQRNLSRPPLPLGPRRRSFSCPQGQTPSCPTKTVHGVFNTPLNKVWDIVAPQIRDLLIKRRFVTPPSRQLVSSPTARTRRILSVPSSFGLRPISLPPPPRTRTTLPQAFSLFSRTIGVKGAVVECTREP